ncbi:hypothetical protein EVAR_62348_1 [Eumeta japonica]|uniref:Uncharacterized protein n=1 Tax=Eumeta variegata TaxID=151549 RepID=A0A4C1ZPJ9_EUMVA|nr:hypothetical protein EVAR_62348_1 [Eumeta japonica]
MQSPTRTGQSAPRALTINVTDTDKARSFVELYPEKAANKSVKCPSAGGRGGRDLAGARALFPLKTNSGEIISTSPTQTWATLIYCFP